MCMSSVCMRIRIAHCIAREGPTRPCHCSAAPDYAALNLTTEIATLTAVDCGRCAATEPLLPVPAASGVAESTHRRFCPASQQSQAPAPHPRGAWLRAPSVDCHLPDSLCFHASAESSPPFESPDPRVAAT